MLYVRRGQGTFVSSLADLRPGYVAVTEPIECQATAVSTTKPLNLPIRSSSRQRRNSFVGSQRLTALDVRA